MKPLVKDMSQWSSRFSVLEHHDYDSNHIPIHTPNPAPSTDQQKTMSLPPIVPPSPLSHQKRFYIRSARVRFSTFIHAQLKTLDTGAKLGLSALLDSGATGLFLDSKFVQDNNLNTKKLPRAVPVYNVDGTLNQGGSIKEEVDMIMTYNNHSEKATFAVCNLGDKAAIIGHTWLHRHNPEIDWQTGDIQFTRCPPNCRVQVAKAKSDRRKRTRMMGRLPLLSEDENSEAEDVPETNSEMEEGDRVFVAFLHPQHTVNATQTVSQKLAERSMKPDWDKRSFEEIVPPQYHPYKSVFSKESFDELPDKRPWDHII
jgi:hypothetical protein